MGCSPISCGPRKTLAFAPGEPNAKQFHKKNKITIPYQIKSSGY
jgi:hypothetical protein